MVQSLVLVEDSGKTDELMPVIKNELRAFVEEEKTSDDCQHTTARIPLEIIPSIAVAGSISQALVKL